MAKKNHMESDIFGCKKDKSVSGPPKPPHSLTNNIYGSGPGQPTAKSNIYSDKNKSTIFDEAPPQQPSNRPDRQRSNIFGTHESAPSGPARAVSEKFKSNIFGSADNDEQSRRQPGTRSGLRVGYNPISGRSYATENGVNSKVEPSETVEMSQQADGTVESVEPKNGEQGKDQHASSADNGDAQSSIPTAENGNGHACADKATNGHGTAKNGHTNVRVQHPPGGKSNGPLW